MNTKESPDKRKNNILPSISLPKGGGALNNIGEKFSVNTVTGTGTATIPLPVSPGRNGFHPQLELSYDSGAGNSPFGVGWNVSIPSIVRKTAKGLPVYRDEEESDVFVLSGAEDLVPYLEEENNWERKIDTESDTHFNIHYYRPGTEGGFAKIEKWVNKTDPGDIHWKTVTGENITSIYGKENRIVNPLNEKQIFQWLLEESRDNRGNIIQYEYLRENEENIDASLPSEYYRVKDKYCFSQRYIKTISYCNQTPDVAADWHFQIVFDYGDHHKDRPTPTDYKTSFHTWNLRPDPFSTYRSGFEIRTYRLCERILLFHQFDELNGGEPTLVRSTDLKHRKDPVTTTLIEARQTGYLKNGNGYGQKETPPIVFSYSDPVVGQTVKTVPKDSLAQLPVGLGNDYQFVDLEGEGVSGILTEQAAGWFYKTNNGNGHFTEARLLHERPSLIGGGRPQIQDIDGDGNKELVVMTDRTTGFYDYKDSEWENFTPFEAVPNIDWRDPNVKFIDLNGDGFSDVLITEDDLLRWFPSKAKSGYETSKTVRKHMDEQKGPALVFADEEQSVYLADMSGDGLMDIVRVKNKDICYWPNMGYARFGAKVTMNNAPLFDHPDQFNRQNIRLADIDGTGTTDILYFNAEGARFWINRSGNGWGETNTLEQFPGVDGTAHVQLTDLLGTGTPCLVWSSPLPNHVSGRMKYIDLMEPVDDKPLGKPYLLNGIDNNMGKVDRFHYAPSTRFYLEDKQAGKPWITKLPFPVYVVEKVETIDEISKSRLMVSYKYHHGYFDPLEREFRGFGMVEQVDSETFEEFEATDPDAEQKEHFIHPILTKTWFHTGAYVKEKVISKQYESEYFKETDVPGAEHPVENYLSADSVIETIGEPDFDAAAEACRVMRGQALRQEVYALDGSEKEHLPYTVTETNFIVREIQPKKRERHGVFMAVTNENMVFNYERDCRDPRVAHSITLETDHYGTPLQTAEVAYPRRKNDRPDLPEEQLTLHIIVKETEVIHKDREETFYVLGVPVEEKSFEVTGPAPAGVYFTAEELRTKLEGVEEIPFHAEPGNDKAQKRLLSRRRNYFWKADASSELLFGEIEWPLLPHHSESAVFTPELIENVFAGKLSDQDIGEKGGYVLRDGYWWNPGIIAHYLYHDQPPESDTRNRENPFLFPVETQDPFEPDETKRPRVFYDDYYLAAVSADDPEGNTVRTEIDYRTLSPTRLTGINENISEVITDEFGRVIAATSYGTEEKADGTVFMNGDLPIAEYDRMEDPAVSIKDIISDPHKFLQGTGTFFFYDIDAWKNRKEPPQYISIARETHAGTAAGNGETEVQTALGYSDGFGRELQQKIKVEVGKAYLNDGNGGLIIDPVSGKPKMEEVSERWLSSGRTVVNNKQKPVKQYEPYYVDSPSYLSEEGVTKIGITSVLHYDPLMRVIKTDTPKGFFSKVEFSSWKAKIYDLNDTVKDSDYFKGVFDGTIQASEKEKEALMKANEHYDTPSLQVFDTLGRPFQTIETDREGKSFITLTTYNITGQPLTITDPRQFELNKGPDRQDSPVRNFRHVYDMAGTPLHTVSTDAGESRAFINVLGNPVYSWTPRGFRNTVVYDFMQRPIELWVEGGDFSVPVMVEKMNYAQSDTPASKNQRGELIRHYDQTGKNEVLRIGFKGEVLQNAKQFISLFDPDQTGVLKDDVGKTLNWDVLGDPDLESEVFTSSGEFNALGRVITSTGPDKSVHKPTFNHSGQLVKVDVKLRGTGDFIPYVKKITYNEKGRRKFIQYGNDAQTDYYYDPKTYQLIRLETSRPQNPGVLQDIHYYYDPAGNITHIRDEAQQTIYFHNSKIDPINDYTYDALYQLIKATGREHIGQTGFTSPMDQVDAGKVLPHKGDGQAMRNYTRTYDYDMAGNMLGSAHKAQDAGYTRKFSYDPNSNRLLKSGVGQELDWQSYTYDAAGNMQHMVHLNAISWNYKNEIRQIEKTDVTAWYQYDDSGGRARKIVRKGSNKLEVRYYIDDLEIYREYKDGRLQLERETMHVMDDTGRIAMVDTLTVKDGKKIEPNQVVPLHRYQFGNHLGSASIELDETANVISYEEYYPYGGSSYQAVDKTREVPRKRYRYAGMERDEESGLNYHFVRYYAPWLCRWLKPDPAGLKDGLNIYSYVKNNPVVFNDRSGENSDYLDAGKAWEKEVIDRISKRIAVVEQVTVKAVIDGKNVTSILDALGVDKKGLVFFESKLSRTTELTSAQKAIRDHLAAGGQIKIAATQADKIEQLGKRLGLSPGASIAGTRYKIVHRGNVGVELRSLKAIPQGYGTIVHKSGRVTIHPQKEMNEIYDVLRKNPSMIAEDALKQFKERSIAKKLRTVAAKGGMRLKSRGGYATLGTLGIIAIAGLTAGTIIMSEDRVETLKELATSAAVDASIYSILTKVFKIGGGIATVVTMVIGMESDNTAHNEAMARYRMINNFLAQNFPNVIERYKYCDKLFGVFCTGWIYDIKDQAKYKEFSKNLSYVLDNPFEFE